MTAGLRRPLLRVVTAFLVLAVIGAGVGVVFTRGGGGYRLTAYFTESNGIYPGNHVDILGLPVGTVQSVTPKPGRVKVVMSLPSDVKLPNDVQAYIVPPSVISDRYVGLSPAYGHGPTLPNHSVLSGSRTHVPAEFDDLVGSLTSLFTALGPSHADRKGAVGRLVKVLAANLAGNGTKIHDTIQGLAGATGALAGNGKGLAAILSNLDRLSRALATRSSLISSFDVDLAGATAQLAGERRDITRVVDNLSVGLGELASFIHEHRAALGNDVRDLLAVTTSLLQHQRTLIETLDNLPLASQNIARSSDGQGGIRIRNQDTKSQLGGPQLAKICSTLHLSVCSLIGSTP